MNNSRIVVFVKNGNAPKRPHALTPGFPLIFCNPAIRQKTYIVFEVIITNVQL